MVACVLVLIPILSYSSNSKGVTYSLAWTAPLEYASPDGKKEKYLFFPDAQYREMPGSPLPFWAGQIDLNTYTPQHLTVSIIDPVYTALSAEELEVLSNYPAGVRNAISESPRLHYQCGEIRKKYFATP